MNAWENEENSGCAAHGEVGEGDVVRSSCDQSGAVVVVVA